MIFLNEKLLSGRQVFCVDLLFDLAEINCTAFSATCSAGFDMKGPIDHPAQIKQGACK